MAGTPRCARPGCGGVAAAWLSYDYAGQHVWLDDPGGENGAGHHSALCATHAGRLRPPQGWSFQDRRSGHAVPSVLPPPPARSLRPPAADDVADAWPAEPAGPGGPPDAKADTPAEAPANGGTDDGLTAIAV